MAHRSTNDATKTLKSRGGEEVVNLYSCRLLVLSGQDKKKTFDLDRDVLRIGSLPGCDIVLNDEHVSRHHCELRRQKDGYHIRDLESTNGTYVNDIKVGDALLKNGAVIRIGETQLRFQPERKEITLVPSSADRFGDVLGKSPKMRQLYTLLERVAPSDITLVLEGETGTGKELLARSIQQKSNRNKGPFIVVDCGAIAENLVESELFGHEKGSFTGADQLRRGAFEAAEGGTIFLDEIGELPLELQPKLLRVLEQREVRRLGNNRPFPVDVRVIAATHRNLEVEVKNGRFREDLFFRLAVVKIFLPPLRERKEDLPMILEKMMSVQHRISGVSPEALRILEDYSWPGNIRQLRNIMERALTLAEGPSLMPKDIAIPSDLPIPSVGEPVISNEQGGKTLEETEKTAIEEALKNCHWNKTAAAKSLGIAYSTLHEKIKKYQIQK